MGKQTQEDLKLIRSGLLDGERHRLLNGLMGAIGQELQQRLGVTLPPPTGRRDEGDTIRLRLALQEGLSDQQVAQLRGVLQRCSNPHELLAMLDRSGFFHGDK